MKLLRVREWKNKLIESKKLEENLRTDATRASVEHDKS